MFPQVFDASGYGAREMLIVFFDGYFCYGFRSGEVFCDSVLDEQKYLWSKFSFLKDFEYVRVFRVLLEVDM